MTPSTPSDAAQHVIAALLAGGTPNGTTPESCGPWAETVRTLYTAHADGGTAAVIRQWETVIRLNPRAAALLAGDHPKAINIHALRDLLAKEFPPTRWIVPGVLPEGTTLLVAKPKIGKTWLTQGIAVAVASGGAALGHITVPRGDVLYLGLEDGERRLKARMLKIIGAAAAPERFDYATTFDHEAGLVALIDAWVQRKAEPRLIVVDTLAKVRGAQAMGQSLYDYDYRSVEALTAYAASHPGIGIVIVHHARKADATDVTDMASGSTGLVGAVDNMLILRRERGALDASLYGTGRDFEEELDTALLWHADLGMWEIGGNADAYRVSRERREILDLLNQSTDALSPMDIAELLDKDRGAIRRLLHSMYNDGQVAQPTRGKYTAVSERKAGASGLLAARTPVAAQITAPAAADMAFLETW